MCVWWHSSHHAPVVWPQVCCFEALRLLSWKQQSVLHRLANGAKKCHETQTLLYHRFSVRCAFLFQFRAGSSAFSSLKAYLVFSQQICLKIVLLLHCPERLKIDGVLVESCDNGWKQEQKVTQLESHINQVQATEHWLIKGAFPFKKKIFILVWKKWPLHTFSKLWDFIKGVFGCDFSFSFLFAVL